jgi:hypothetical protein
MAPRLQPACQGLGLGVRCGVSTGGGPYTVVGGRFGSVCVGGGCGTGELLEPGVRWLGSTGGGP